jgi:hypothetical protein
MRRIGGVLLTVTGLLACPCHMIVTLPLLASVLAGTALGSFLTRNTGLIFIFAGTYFIVALLLGYWLLFGPARRMSNMEEARLTSAPAKTILERSEKVDNVPAIRSME